MNKIWEKLEEFLKINNNELFFDLNPPATETEISKLENQLGVLLPLDFKKCLKVHNGQKGDANGLFRDLEFMSTHRILNEWLVWKDLLDSGDFNNKKSTPASGIKSDWWNPKWIPFTYNGGGDHLCLDLDPTHEGHTGQIITLWHDDDARKNKAQNFKMWFEEFVIETI
jgi:cell wall assembly regulator SMI1